MTASPDRAGSGPARRTFLVRSTLDGALLGACSGIVHGVAVGPWGSTGAAPTASALAGLAAVVALVSAPVGLVLGTVLGVGFGLVARTGVRHLALFEAAVVAVVGGLVLGSAVAGSEPASSGALAGTAGPLVAGVPAAALHGWRAQRRGR